MSYTLHIEKEEEEENSNTSKKKCKYKIMENISYGERAREK